MTGTDLTQLVGPALASALTAKGYDTLTAVQEAVLDPALEGRDLRITSQTGSGKTLAIGFVVRSLIEGAGPPERGSVARPKVLILAPTRELAKQVADELSWLFAPLHARVAAITGGAGYADQRRALTPDLAVLVATPGRLRDALERNKIDPAALGAVILDEADSMLDLGFREDLDAILALLPPDRRSHLVSATFSRDVVMLADRFQRDPVHVEGTRLGEANANIEHVIHLVEPYQRVDALVNLLLSDEDARSLIFVRTRADVARVSGELAEAGFVVRTLSGEMEQPERDRALAAFRAGGVQALVATDVAARGIDVRDIARVIQIEPPTDVETYTHRSGRTGRAGKHGMSVLFVTPSHYPTIARGLSRAKILHRVEAIPGADVIQRAREEKLVAWLSRDSEDENIDPNALSIAERVIAGEQRVVAVARLIEKAGLRGPTRPRDVRAPAPPREGRPMTRPGSVGGPRGAGAGGSGSGSGSAMDSKRPAGDGWVTFQVSWGGRHGADARRLLAVVCRRGDIRGVEVGAIRIEAAYSLVDIAAPVAEQFETQSARPDPRNPLVRITRAPGRGIEPSHSSHQGHRAPRTLPPPPPPLPPPPAPPSRARAERPAEPEVTRPAPVRRVVRPVRVVHDAPPPRTPTGKAAHGPAVVRRPKRK